MAILNVPDLHRTVSSSADHPPLRVIENDAGDLFALVCVVELQTLGPGVKIPGDDTGVIAARDNL